MKRYRRTHSMIVYGLAAISVVLAIISIVVFSDMQEKKIEKLQKQVNEYEEIIDKVEEEVGIIEDLKYQIEGYDITLVRKMHELEELESQISEKQAGLDALNNQ